MNWKPLERRNMATRFYGSGVLQADRGQTRAALPRSKWDRIGGPGLTPSQNRTLVLVSVGFSTARHAGMRPSQPVQEAACGLVWRRSIKRHQRRWNSRDPDDVGSPAVGVDGHDLDLVHATTDGLFKAMNSRMHSLWTDARCLLGTAGIVTRSLHSIKRSAVRNGRPQSCTAAIAHETKRNTFPSTSIQQVMHRSCTGFPQLDGAAHAPYAERT